MKDNSGNMRERQLIKQHLKCTSVTESLIHSIKEKMTMISCIWVTQEEVRRLQLIMSTTSHRTET